MYLTMTDSARERRESQFIQFVQSMNEGKAFQSVKLGCFRAAIRCAGVNPIDYTGIDLDGSVFLRHELNSSINAQAVLPLTLRGLPPPLRCNRLVVFVYHAAPRSAGFCRA